MSRPILPHLPDPEEAPTPNSPNVAESPASSSKPTYAKRGKITIVACVPCRKRKTKCDGKRPRCGQCASRDGECVYDMTSDQRRLTYLRDHSEQLQERQTALENLLNTIQSASENEAMDIVRRLRDGSTDILAIAEQIQAGRLLFNVGRHTGALDPVLAGQHRPRRSPQEANQIADQFDALIMLFRQADFSLSTEVMRRIRNEEDITSILRAASSGRLTAGPLVPQIEAAPQSIEADFASQQHTFGLVKGTTESIPRSFATPPHVAAITAWTDVTQDADLIEHLITLWFCWQHSFFQNFPEKLFRDDMMQGRSKYCSHSLVNAICAAGCFLSNHNQVRVDQPAGQAMVTNFISEARRRLQEAGHPSLPSTAASYIISYVEGTRGNASSMWMIGGESVLMALELNLHLKYTASQSDDEEELAELADVKLARTHAFWGCFHLCQINSFTLGRLSVIPANALTVELPPIDSTSDDDPWEAYDLSLPHRPGARSSTFHYCSTLSTIVNSTLKIFFSPSVPLTGALLLEEYQKYLHWYQDIPSILEANDASPPHVLCLNLYYQSAILQLFRPFLKATIDNSDIVPREVCRQAAQTISELWKMHLALYGLSGILMFQIQCLLSACTIHIVDLPAIAATKHFTDACNAFQQLISWNGWAQSSLVLLRTLAERWKLVLPQEAEEALYRDVGSAELASTPEHNPQPAPWYGRSQSDFAKSPPIPPPGPPRMHSTSLHQVGQMAPQSLHGMPSVEQYSAGGYQSPSQSESSHTASKRLSESESSLPPPSETTSKRQRKNTTQQSASTASNLHRGVALAPIYQQQSQNQPWQEQGQQPVSSYLYTPMAKHQAPLLGPVHSRNTTTLEQSQTEERGPAQHSGPFDETSGLQESVEGLTFGDDWRDPFMSYLPGEQQ